MFPAPIATYKSTIRTLSSNLDAHRINLRPIMTIKQSNSIHSFKSAMPISKKRLKYNNFNIESMDQRQ